jgi:transmembrane sensor
MNGGAPTRAEREASEWIALLDDADATLKDHQRFRKWLAASAENRIAYEAVSRTWDRLDALKRLENIDIPQARPRRLDRRFVLVGGVAAASIAGLAAISLLRPQSPLGVVHETATGERATFTLNDGSTLVLNARSRARVVYSENQRLALLDKGEALFDVARDPDRPFVVETAFGSIRVLGTSFVVKVREASVRATVLRGLVEARAANGAARRRVEARASEEVVLARGAVHSESVTPETVAHRTAWRQGMLAFDGETLLEACADVERQTGVRFAFSDKAIGELRLGGVIHADDSEAFTDLLRNLGIAAERRADGSVLLTRVP